MTEHWVDEIEAKLAEPCHRDCADCERCPRCLVIEGLVEAHLRELLEAYKEQHPERQGEPESPPPLIGTKERPYVNAPPGMGEDGLPWGAFCLCSGCGELGCSTVIFDYYGEPRAPLICGQCMGCDLMSAGYSIAHARAHPDNCDPLGPGCRGGYVESMGATVTG